MNKEIDITGITITTERLILRPWKETDLEDFYEQKTGVVQRFDSLRERKKRTLRTLVKIVGRQMASARKKQNRNG